MRLYAYHNGNKHEVDTALLPIHISDHGSVVFVENRYELDNNGNEEDYQIELELKSLNTVVELPLVNGNILIAKITDWLVEP
jgi:uncharacterized protein YqkB